MRYLPENNPLIRLQYPDRLPREMVTSADTPETQIVVAGDIVAITWHLSLTQASDIKLTDQDAQLLLRYIAYSGADHYEVNFPHNPRLNRTVPVSRLPEVITQTQMDCFTGAFIDPAILQNPLEPPAIPQIPVNGRCTHTSPAQAFTFQYPADCGQMWEATNAADNEPTCTGNPQYYNVGS